MDLPIRYKPSDPRPFCRVALCHVRVQRPSRRPRSPPETPNVRAGIGSHLLGTGGVVRHKPLHERRNVDRVFKQLRSTTRCIGCAARVRDEANRFINRPLLILRMKVAQQPVCLLELYEVPTIESSAGKRIAPHCLRAETRGLHRHRAGFPDQTATRRPSHRGSVPDGSVTGMTSILTVAPPPRIRKHGHGSQVRSRDESDSLG
jgi:hypothetical protein